MKRALLVLGVVAASVVANGSSAAISSTSATPLPTSGRIATASVFGSQLLTLNPDGSGAAVLSYADDRDPAWAPDGALLAVSSTSTGNGDIYILSPDGRERRQITNSSQRESDPAWAPGGTLLAYERGEADTAVQIIYADGSGVQLVADGPGCDEDPSFSPDGGRIAFTSCRSGSPQIYTMNVDGSDLTRLTPDDGRHRNPTWSPDGSKIAYDSTRGDRLGIYTIRPDGTGEEALTAGSGERAPAWSPDGRAIAYEALNREAGLAVMRLEDHSEVLVGHGAAAPSWQPVPGGDGCSHPGTSARDVVAGGAESDIVCGRDGDDAVRGGPGGDVLRGEAGDDVLDARDGDPDIVDGGSGFDRALVDRADRTVGVEDVRFVEPRNVARGRPVSASMWWVAASTEFAVDGSGAGAPLMWGGEFPPQWVEVDLGRSFAVRSIELVVAQTPPGETIHVIRGRTPTGRLVLLKVLARDTRDDMVIRITPKRPWRGIRAVRITTVESPSWVAWKEIRVLR